MRLGVNIVPPPLNSEQTEAQRAKDKLEQKLFPWGMNNQPVNKEQGTERGLMIV